MYELPTKNIFYVYIYAYNPVAYIRMFSIIRNVRRFYQIIINLNNPHAIPTA